MLRLERRRLVVLFPIIHIFIAAFGLFILILILLLLLSLVNRVTMNIILIFLIDLVVILNHALLLAATRSENGGVALDPPFE